MKARRTPLVATVVSSRSMATRIRRRSSIRRPEICSRTSRSAGNLSTACQPATGRSTSISPIRVRWWRSTPRRQPSSGGGRRPRASNRSRWPSTRPSSGCRSGMMAVSDYQAGKVVSTVPIGTGVDGAGFDPASADAFASNGEGTLTVIHRDGPDQYRVAATLQTAPGSRNMGLDLTNHRIFVVSAKFGPVPANAAGSRRRGPVLPGSFSVMVIERDPSIH